MELMSPAQMDSAQSGSEEQWKWVVGYEDIYEVSDQGRIRSWTNLGGQKVRPTEPRPMKSVHNYAGYHVLTLSKDGIRTQHRLHCLVLQAFVGPRPKGYQGAHRDDDKNNNHLSNLAWKTVGENIRDRHLNGRTARGARSGAYKHGKFIGTNRKYYPPKYVSDLAVEETAGTIR